MKIKILIISSFLFLGAIFTSQAQYELDKWTAGVDFSGIIFSDTDRYKIGSGDKKQWQIPVIQVSRELFDFVSIDLVYTFTILPESSINPFKYSSIDGYLKYEFPEVAYVQPFAGIGLGYVSGSPRYFGENPPSALSFNIMAGGTLWISENFGLTSRLIYKMVSADAEAMNSHFQGLAGVVYRFRPGSFFGGGQYRQREWGR